jgi:SAM-dependent methyltransferase
MSTSQVGADEAQVSMRAEFDTFAAWTTASVQSLGARYAVPAACRGSGTPAALSWLLDALRVPRGGPLLDIGAGLGGPAAYAQRQHGVRPVCVDPMPQACLGALDLFGLDVVQAEAGRMPFADNSFGHAWSLGTLCTTPDRVGWLAEWGRVLTRGARLGAMVLVSTDAPFATLRGNVFPSLPELDRLWAGAGFYPVRQRWTRRLPQAGAEWREAEDRVAQRIWEVHGEDPRYALVQAQQRTLGQLIRSGRVRGLLVVLARA